MTSPAIAGLGRAAALARAAGLGDLARLARDAADGAFLRVGVLPLRAPADGLQLRGFLRHRSFLDAVGAYEPFTRELFLQALRPAITVVDGGAHIGLYTLLAAARVAGGEVLAFEADPFNLRALTLNVRRHRASNVTIVPRALWERTGRMTFHSSEGTLGSSLVPRYDVGRTRRADVPVTTLDHELGGRDMDACVIKLDVEGGEPAALRGMQEALRRARQVVLFVEVNPAALHQAGESPQALLDLIVRCGLRAYFIEERERRLRPVAASMPPRKGNLYCVREPAA